MSSAACSFLRPSPPCRKRQPHRARQDHGAVPGMDNGTVSRILVLVAAILAAAVLPQTALGVSPRLLVTAGDRNTTTMELGDPDGTTSSVAVYAPPGYSVGLDRAPGTRVG